MTTFVGVGCMSGSSLDGLDVCLVEFTGDFETDIWGYRIIKGLTIPYTPEWEEKLRGAAGLSGEQLIQLHVSYGHYIGQVVHEFISDDDFKPDFIASHGHTIFHRPELGYTFQLGDGETTSSYFKCPFVSNFRNKDVALGGQGAPLVPNGDKYLYSSYDICINLGGISNIGLKGQRGYDICPCNFVMNKLANMQDAKNNYDMDGQIGASGSIIDSVLERLESLPFYSKKSPKSMSTQWIQDFVLPILSTEEHSIPDLMRTFIEHVAIRLTHECLESKALLSKDSVSVLVTGGGAFNKTLMQNIHQKVQGTGIELKEADNQTIEFKEALIFAFLGLRCILGQDNISMEVTGSRSDSVSGSIHRPLSTGNTLTKFEKSYFEFKKMNVKY